LPPGTLVISGGALGVDQLAVKTAKIRGLQTKVFRPNWKPDGKTLDKTAGFKRNKLIVAAAEVVIAFWLPPSNGTRNSIDLTLDAGKGLRVVTPEHKPRWW